MARRCGILHRVTGFRTTAVSASVLAHAMYGAQINGLSGKQIKSLEGIVGVAMMGYKYTRAMPEAIRMIWGDSSKCDPWVRLVRQTIETWTRKVTDLQEAAEDVWGMCGAGRGTHGPTNTVYKMVKSLSWNPRSATIWVDESEKEWKVPGNIGSVEALCRKTEKILWSKVPPRRTRDGGGLEEGVNRTWTRLTLDKWLAGWREGAGWLHACGAFRGHLVS